jgi:hypothetical protein
LREIRASRRLAVTLLKETSMLGFVETLCSRGAVRLDDIERVAEERPNEHGVMLRKVHMRGGQIFDTFSHENGGLLTRPVQIIPANPGTSIIRIYLDDGEPETLRSAVIAWGLCLDGEVRPIAPGGVCDGLHRDTHVELPDGSIEGVTEWSEPAGFKNAESMLAYYVAERDKQIGAAERARDEAQTVSEPL